MNLLLDNIIFSLQKAGGISVVWENIIKVLQQSKLLYECWEYPRVEENIVYNKLGTHNAIRKKTMSMFLERYTNPMIKTDDPFIFHSSYYRICLNRNAVNITTVHDFTYEKFTKGLTSLVHKVQKNHAIRHSDFIVCISENTKKDLLNFLPDIDENKIRIIYNGVSEDYKPIKTHRWDELGDYVVFVGSRQLYKQFEFTVKALKDTPYNLAVVGGRLSNKEVSFLNETLGNKRYLYTGFLTNEELNELYNQAVCLSYPSVYEGFGIPVLEAQRAGCPVIAYNASSIPEIIGDTPLLLEKLSIEEFHSKLQLLKDSSVRNLIIQSGIKNSQRFSWEKMGKEYLNLYNELMSLHNL